MKPSAHGREGQQSLLAVVMPRILDNMRSAPFEGFARQFERQAALIGVPRALLGVELNLQDTICSNKNDGNNSFCCYGTAGTGRVGEAPYKFACGDSTAKPHARSVFSMCGGAGASASTGGFALKRGTTTLRANNCRGRSARAP